MRLLAELSVTRTLRLWPDTHVAPEGCVFIAARLFKPGRTDPSEASSVCVREEEVGPETLRLALEWAEHRAEVRDAYLASVEAYDCRRNLVPEFWPPEEESRA